MKSRTALSAFILFGVCAGCASGNIRDDFVAGWQSQRDVAIHGYVHQNFTQQRRWAAQHAVLVNSGSLDWPDYATPALATAIRAQAVAQDRGRALVLEQFLEHMRMTPTAEATAAWFAGEAADIRNAAQKSVDSSQALLADLAGAEAVNEALFRRIEATAASRGVVRGRALQHADLRRTTRLYFQARDDRVEIPDDEEMSVGTSGIGARPDALVRDVNQMLGAADLRSAILLPRRCERAGDNVVCTPDRGGTTSRMPLDEDVNAAQPTDSLTSPGRSAISSPGVSSRDFFEGQSGW